MLWQLVCWALPSVIQAHGKAKPGFVQKTLEAISTFAKPSKPPLPMGIKAMVWGRLSGGLVVKVCLGMQDTWVQSMGTRSHMRQSH